MRESNLSYDEWRTAIPIFITNYTEGPKYKIRLHLQITEDLSDVTLVYTNASVNPCNGCGGEASTYTAIMSEYDLN